MAITIFFSRKTYGLTRSCVAHIVGRQSELRKVLFEKIRQVSGLTIIFSGIGPRLAHKKHFLWHTRTTGRCTQAKDRINNAISTLNLAADRRLDHGTRVIDVDTLTNTIRTTGPASIDQVAAYVMLFNP